MKGFTVVALRQNVSFFFDRLSKPLLSLGAIKPMDSEGGGKMNQVAEYLRGFTKKKSCCQAPPPRPTTTRTTRKGKELRRWNTSGYVRNTSVYRLASLTPRRVFFPFKFWKHLLEGRKRVSAWFERMFRLCIPL